MLGSRKMRAREVEREKDEIKGRMYAAFVSI
jgi:hypothetical protein